MRLRRRGVGSQGRKRSTHRLVADKDGAIHKNGAVHAVDGASGLACGGGSGAHGRGCNLKFPRDGRTEPATLCSKIEFDAFSELNGMRPEGAVPTNAAPPS